jgi:hypothetical protein
MRGLLKRDDPKLQASVASTHQVLLGSCLTAHASEASLSLGELPLRMHVRNEPITRRLLSYGASADAEAFIPHSLEACCTHPLIYRSHAHPRPPLLASSSCFPRPQLGLLVLG